MHGKDLEIIKELMEALSGEMEYSEDDFAERLGRKKPDVSVMKIEAEPMDPGSDEGAMEDEDMDGAMELADIEDSEDEEDDMMPERSSLKERLMRLRG